MIDLNEPWRKQARCRGVDPNFFFPKEGDSIKSQQEFCAGCEVRAECLDYALRAGEKFGIWGGHSERARRRIARKRRLQRLAS